MKTSGIALLSKVSSLPSGTTLAEMSLLCGKDKHDKTRYLNGSFIVSEKTKGLVSVEAALKCVKPGDSVMVRYEIGDLHAETSVKGERVYINWRGFLNTVDLHTPAAKEPK